MTEHAPETTALSETASIARDLIRFDTSNRGEGDANPESDAAAYVSRAGSAQQEPHSDGL